MKKILLPIFILFFTLSSSVVADTAPSEMAKEMADMDKMSSQLRAVDKKLKRGDFEGSDLAAWTKLTIKMKSEALLCVSNRESALLEL